MLSALLKSDPLDANDIDRGSESAGGFGKMLNSLHGLQQRLEDFSLSDAANAEANAQTLILRLRQFQGTIATLALLKKAAADINRSIAEILQIDTDNVNVDDLENHPQLHAIVKASNLIPLQKLMSAQTTGAKVGDSQVEPIDDNIAAVLPSVELTANRPNAFLDASVPESAEYEFAGLPEMVAQSTASAQTIETDATTPSTTALSPVLESAPDAPTLAFTATEQMPREILATSEFPTAEAEFESAVAAVVKPSSPAGEALWEAFPAPAERLAEIMAAANSPQPVEPKQLAQIAAPKTQKSRAKGADPLDASKALVLAKESFDLRLLDDLVSNYGDFAANLNLPAAIEKKEIQSFESAPKAAEEFQPEGPSPVEATAALVRKDGDLDPQFKKIIRDYGEYDLYADQQKTSIKKAGILAFVVLGLLLGVIYFFKAPPSTPNTDPAAASSTPSVTQDDQKFQPGAQGANSDNREKSFGSTPQIEKPTAKINN